MTEKLEQHHVQYKEIHGQDVIIMVTPDEHRDIHRHRPTKMKGISKKVKQSAQARSPGGKQIEKRYAQSEIGQRTRKNLHADSKTKFFSRSFGEYTRLVERISHNSKTENVTYSATFQGTQGHKLPVVNLS